MGVPQDRIVKHTQFGKRFKTKIPKREEWKKNEALGHGDIWFTDGSKGDRGTGFGICGPKRRMDSAHSLRRYNTVFQAEMAAIGTCAKNLLQERVEGRIIRICTDSQASIMALENPTTTSALVKGVKETLDELGVRNKIFITCIPGHSGYKGNERADKLAKQGAESNVPHNWEVGMPYQEGCGIIDKTMEKEKWTTWEKSQGYRWSKELLGNHIGKWAKEITNMEKQQARTVLGLFTGHSELRCYTHKTQGHSNLCRWCNEKEETPRHILCECPALMEKRQKWLGCGFLDQEIFVELDLGGILAFYKAVGL